jgi:uncharacterized protein YndB with AHSA1/START domain
MSDVDTKTAAGELKMEREFSHSPSEVFQAWTQEDALRKWMGPGEITAPDSKMDTSVGGVLTIPMVHADGSVMTASGKILELVPDRKLRFTWAWDQEDGSAGQTMEITLDFIATKMGTMLTLHQTNFIDDEARDHHFKGWTGCFEKLEGHLAAS